MVKGLNKKRGFSFVELTIAVSIFAFLSTVTVMSYNNFNNRIGVDILAHQIAQFGHEAQVSALSVKRSVGGDFPGYGIHFDKASTTQFIFFADLDNDKVYTPGGVCGTSSAECEKVVQLLKGVTFKTMCGMAAANGITDDTNCTLADGAPHASESFDIVFRRPSPDASILGRVPHMATSSPYSVAKIKISSAKGYTRSILFYITGQITVK